jgi:hypothetical protein
MFYTFGQLFLNGMNKRNYILLYIISIVLIGIAAGLSGRISTVSIFLIVFGTIGIIYKLKKI